MASFTPLRAFTLRIVQFQPIRYRRFSTSKFFNMASSYDAVRRRLIVCCDGTWQSSVSGERNIPSNVTRMCRHLAQTQVVKEGDKTVLYQQMVYYDPGVGTGDLGNDEKAIQGGTGAGLAQNVLDCYNWLSINYQPGDKIYCFGFSRGAYTARSLAGFVAELGICDAMNMIYFPEIYHLYEHALYPASDKDSAQIKDARARFEAKKTKWLSGESINFHLGDDPSVKFEIASGPRKPISPESMQIEVVGVWDTVGSLGVPKIGGWLKLPSLFLGLDKPGQEFHDVRISDNVHHAFHALALDERRLPFTPTLWYVPKSQERPRGKSFKQVWFPGVHINCGGGSDDILKMKKSDCEQISNITFAWMVQQCRPFLGFDEDSIKRSIKEQQDFLGFLENNYKLEGATSGWALGPVIDSFDEAGFAIKLGGERWRSPGDTWQPENLVDKTEVRTSSLGVTNEEIHPCVFWRMQKLKKRSPALQGFKRQPRANPKDGWEWVKKGSDGQMIRLPEFRITPHPENSSEPRNFERLLADANQAGNYVADLDQMYNNGVDKTPSSDPITKAMI